MKDTLYLSKRKKISYICNGTSLVINVWSKSKRFDGFRMQLGIWEGSSLILVLTLPTIMITNKNASRCLKLFKV